MSYGIKVAIEGKDVSSADPNDFTIHSAYNTLKVAKEGYGTMSLPDSTVNYQSDHVDITHNLGHKPFFLAFYHIDDGAYDLWFPSPSVPYNAGGAAGIGYYFGSGYTHPNTNTVRLSFDILDRAALDVPYKYYVFIDPNKEAWSE